MREQKPCFRLNSSEYKDIDLEKEYFQTEIEGITEYPLIKELYDKYKRPNALGVI